MKLIPLLACFGPFQPKFIHNVYVCIYLYILELLFMYVFHVCLFVYTVCTVHMNVCIKYICTYVQYVCIYFL